MANLYYELLFSRRPDVALERTYYGLSDFYGYLKGVEEHLEKTRLTLRWELAGALVELRTAGPAAHLPDLLGELAENPDGLRLRPGAGPDIAILCAYPEERAVLLASPLPPGAQEQQCALLDQRGQRRLRCLARAVPRPPMDRLLPPTPAPLKAEATAAEREAHQAAAAEALARWQGDALVQRYHGLKPAWVALVEPEAEGDRTAEAFMDEEVAHVFEAIDARRERYGDERRLTIHDRDPERLLLALERLPCNPTLCVRPNTYVVTRQRLAISLLQDQPRGPQKPLLDLFQREDKVHWPAFAPTPVPRWLVLTDAERPGTQEQRTFVESALATPDFMLLEGPPGSGKTTAILELVLQLAARGQRALLCASTHVAVDNVIERIKEPRNAQRDAVLVLRIGKERAVRSELARQYLLERMARTESRDLREQLDQRPQRSPAQEALRDALRPPDGQERWSQVLFDCAQLVCGTTIGILQHPALKHSEVPFDYLILDEASKTTFTEFLVPALRAKRWIIVGDRRQLSPYVDEDWIASAVAAALTRGQETEQAEEQARALLDAYNLQQEQERRRPIAPDSAAERRSALTLWSNQIAWRLIREYELRLLAELRAPAPDEDDGDVDLLDIEDEDEDVSADEDVDADQRADEDLQEDDDLDDDDDDLDDPTLDEQVLRYRQERKRLQPRGKDGARVREAIDRVRRAALPSVMEALQLGHGSSRHREADSALELGLPEQALEQRLVSLRYQHRMHPEISAFPRTHIYQEQNLLDPPGQDARRLFPYPGYRYRSLWIDVQGREGVRNDNPEEVKIVLRELRNLADWAAAHPRPADIPSEPPQPWSVAVLTFYRGQERLLRDALRELTGDSESRQSFTLQRGARSVLTLDLCTVDRFQGHEADVVYLSLVRTTSVGFLRSPNRLNVALTRARYQLVLVGSRAFFRGRRCRSELLQALAERTPSERAYGEDQR